jgi:two-component system sensor histidine kinase KdpD
MGAMAREWLSAVERRPVRPLTATLGSIGAVAAVSLAVGVLHALGAPALSLGVLYLFAVLPVAVLWRMPYAIAVAVASMLAFNWLFLPPVHTLDLATSENWIALAVYLLTALSVSALAERAARRAAEAERRRREALFAAEAAGLLLQPGEVRAQLAPISERVAGILGARSAQLGLDEDADAPPGATRIDAGGRPVAWLALDGATASPETRARVATVLGSLLATALERERLAHDDAVKTAILRSVSHDLRSPITAIRTAGEVLEHADELAPADAAELFATIRAQARRLDRLVANLLDLSRLEAGAVDPAPELWPVDGLVTLALESVARDARIDVRLEGDLPPVRVDAAQLEHALVNLLENALTYSPAGARVELSAALEEGRVVLRVRDAGPGIAAADRERIFEPFDRGAGGRPGGSGLGLAIARGFAELNGGSLHVEEHGPGATFALELPAAPVAAGTPA